MRYLFVVLSLAVIAFITMVIDGVALRDPNVQLGHGYGIVATHWGGSCCLIYEPWNDKREHSEWQVRRFVDRDEDGTKQYSYDLHNKKTRETLEFYSIEELKADERAKNAEPSVFGMDEYGGITQFGRRGPVAIGNYDRGYFILNVDEDSVEGFTSRDEWAKKAVALGMSVDNLADPKGWLVQYRGPVYYAFIGTFLLFTLPWAFYPLCKKRKATGDDAA